MLRPYQFYKHRNNTDVAIFPLSIYACSEGLKVKVRWINIAAMTPYDMGIAETILIKPEQVKNWEEYDDEIRQSEKRNR